jgi:hypothetical protein
MKILNANNMSRERLAELQTIKDSGDEAAWLAISQFERNCWFILTGQQKDKAYLRQKKATRKQERKLFNELAALRDDAVAPAGTNADLAR